MIWGIVMGFAAVAALVKLLTPSEADYARIATTHRLNAAPSDLRDGEAVTLSGVVVAGGVLLESPLSGTACVFWAAEARVIERQRRQSIVTDELHAAKLAPFVLQTSHGAISVEGEEAITELAPRAVIPRDIERDRAFLQAHGGDPYFARTSGFDEVVVVPGQRISVYGVVVIERAQAEGEAGYRDEGVTIRLVDHPAHRLTLGKPR